MPRLFGYRVFIGVIRILKNGYDGQFNVHILSHTKSPLGVKKKKRKTGQRKAHVDEKGAGRLAGRPTSVDRAGPTSGSSGAKRLGLQSIQWCAQNRGAAL